MAAKSSTTSTTYVANSHETQPKMPATAGAKIPVIPTSAAERMMPGIAGTVNKLAGRLIREIK